MTAGGGWVNPDTSPREALTVLGVGCGDVVLQVERCKGECCSKIALGTGWGLEGGLNPDELQAMGDASAGFRDWRDRDGVRRPPVRDGALIADLFESIGEHASPDGSPMNYFRCRRHCLTTGNCGIYDSRPSMCAAHGLRGICDVPTCTMRVQVNPLALRDPLVPPQELSEPVDLTGEKSP